MELFSEGLPCVTSVHRKTGSCLQTREALQAILKDLHEEDHFAIVVFDTTVSEWRETLTKATKENIAKANEYVKKIKDRGCKRKTIHLSNVKDFLIPHLSCPEYVIVCFDHFFQPLL